MSLKPASKMFLISAAAFISILLCVTSYSSAQMPSYAELQDITASLTDSFPMNVSIDKNDNLYVVEHNAKKIRVYSQNGSYKKSFSLAYKPRAVEVDDNGRIYIGYGDIYNTYGFVEVYENTSGSNLNALFYIGAQAGDFIRPNDMAIDAITGYMYVVDYLANVVAIYNPSNPGTPVGIFNGSDATDGLGGAFNEPTSVAIDRVNQQIVVLDRPIVGSGVTGARIQFFDMSGNYITAYDKYSADGLAGTLHTPYFIDIDSLGRIYASCALYGTINVYSGTGDYLGEIPNYKLTNAFALSVSNSSILYVTQIGRRLVKRFALDPYTMMDITPSSLTFSGQAGSSSPVSQNVDIRNDGSAALDWSLSSDESWVDLSTTSGSTASSSVSTIPVGVDISGLLQGTYNGTITVTSGTDSTEQIAIEFTVTAGLGADACIDETCTYNGVEGQAISLDGSASSGDIVYYNWDIDGNGTYEYVDNTTAYQNHIYTNQGDYDVVLKVVDNLGNEAVSSPATASILDSNPTVAFSGTPISGSAPLTVNFTNVSSGYDQPLTYQWDFNNDSTVDSTAANPSYVYTDTGTYSVKLTASDGDSSSVLTRTDYITVSNQYDLTISKTGGGSGTVTSFSPGIDCGGDCNETYSEASVITLNAVADPGSSFTGWSGGGCSGTGTCVTTVNAQTTITAAFDICSYSPVRIDGPEPVYYSTIEDAYSAAVNGDTIQAQNVRFTSMPDLNEDKSVTIEGGYSCDYLSNDGYTTVSANATVSNGATTVSSFILE